MKSKNNNGEKTNIFSKFSCFIKDKCITDTTRTVLIILLLFVAFIALNLWVQSFDLIQKDFTKEKQYTLTDTSKDIMAKIDKDVTAYVWGFSESENVVDLLKQYHTANSRINYKLVSLDEDPKIVQEYDFQDGVSCIAINSGDKTKNIYSYDLMSYDAARADYVDVTEQRITNAILNVTSDKTPKLYFLTGNNISSMGGMEVFKQSIVQNGLYELENLNLLNAGSIPEDCDTLIISSVFSDFSEDEANMIKSYINNGGNILISTDIQFAEFKKLPNFQSILDLYGVTLPNKLIVEDGENSIAKTTSYMYSEISSTNEITKLIKSKPILVNPGLIDLADSEKMAELGVTYDLLSYSSNDSYLYDVETEKALDKGSRPTGVAMTKLVSDGVFSKAVIFSTNLSFSDILGIDIGLSDYTLYEINEELIDNSIAYLNDRGELYSIAKLSNSFSTYLPTKQQDTIVVIIICALPVIIITIGLLIWNRRRKKK